MNQIKKWLTQFHPYNEQERADQSRMLDYLKEEKNLLTRENTKMHFTASAWVLDPDKEKVLMLYHNIYRSWSWSGGHADGEADLLAVAKREAEEETGLTALKPLSGMPLSVEILGVQPHFRKGAFVTAHLHLNLTFLFWNHTAEELRVCLDENSRVGWFLPDDAVEASTETWMQPVYRKLNEKTALFLGRRQENVNASAES